jgi:hypothetical protein
MASTEVVPKPEVQKKDAVTPVKYGELVILGYNGCIAQPTKCDEVLNLHRSGSVYSKRRKSKFILQAKERPSGVKPSAQFNCHSKQDLNVSGFPVWFWDVNSIIV